MLSVITTLCLPHVSAQESAVQKELNRRINNANEANSLLKTGDAAYQKGDYKTAVDDYARAFDLLPIGAMTHEIRQATANRYATAATEHARQLAKVGSYEKARELLKKVLNPQIAPAHIGAIKMMGQIEDPIRYNHALKPNHIKNIQKVARLLREAEGFHSLGQYDRAFVVYQEALRIDPYNKAARRGMEQIDATKSDYYRAANDQRRAAMLNEVAQAWDTANNPKNDGTIPVGPGIASDPITLAPDLTEKLANIIVERTALQNATLEEAVDFIRIQSRLGDIPDAGGEKTGTNIVVNLGDPNSDRAKKIANAQVTLNARGLPLTKILEYVTDQTGTQWRTDGVSVIITPRGSTGDEPLVSRKFRVPPNFLSSSAVQAPEENDDPFGGVDDQLEGKIAKKIDIKQFLKLNGVSFPKGSVTTYSAANSTLLVTNTPSNIDRIDQIVSLAADDEPVMVKITTKIMRVSQSDLKELSFDWVITPWALGRSNFLLGGGAPGSGTPLTNIPQNFIPNADAASPITSGIRSGNGAFRANSIDAFLRNTVSGVTFNPETRAPGIFTVSGVFNSVQVQMMMRGLDNAKSSDLLVNPSTIARSGERTTFSLIKEFLYPTEYEPPELPAQVNVTPLAGGNGALFPVTPATATAFETRDTGITLEVEPTIGPNKKYIELSLRPEFVEFRGFVNYGSPIQSPFQDALGNATTVNITSNSILLPIFETIALKNTTLTIQDGETVVIGGLMRSRKAKVEDKVPLLGDIPLAGRLFRSEATQKTDEAIIITVTTELIDPTGQPWRKR